MGREARLQRIKDPESREEIKNIGGDPWGCISAHIFYSSLKSVRGKAGIELLGDPAGL